MLRGVCTRLWLGLTWLVRLSLRVKAEGWLGVGLCVRLGERWSAGGPYFDLGGL